MNLLKNVAFVATNLIYLSIFLFSCYLLGSWLMRRVAADSRLIFPLILPTGFAIAILLLGCLALMGLLNAVAICVVVIASIVLGGYGHIQGGQPPVNRWSSAFKALSGWVKRYWGVVVVGALIVFPLALTAMEAPHHWDEVSYHLPYARLFAESGALVVNEYLRYPLHTHNYHLLYAAALIFDQEVLTHLIHAASGLIVALGLYFAATHFFNRAVGLVAAIMYLLLVKQMFDKAYLDLGLAMFVFASFYCLALRQVLADDRFLYLAALMLAMAVGTKYQGLLLVPLFGLLVLLITRDPVAIGKSVLIFLAFGTFWYIRNWLISGDPFHPIGAEYFGYWLWNEQDLQGQQQDILRYKDTIPWVLWPGFASVFFWRRSGPVYRGLCVVAFFSLLFWFLTSRHGRYLVPAYSFMAVLSAYVIVEVANRTGFVRWINSAFVRWGWGRIRAKIVLMILLAPLSVAASVKYWNRLCGTQECLDAYLTERMLSYPILKGLPDRDALKIYQYGLENEIYYIGPVVFGDWYGGARYSEIFARNGKGEALKSYLETLGANSLLVNRVRPPFSDFRDNESFYEYFELIRSSPSAVLYRVRDS